MEDYSDLLSRARSARRRVDERRGERRRIALAGKKTKEEIEHLRSQIELYEKVAAVLTNIGEERQNAAQEQIEALVTQGLRTIFGEELSFHVVSSIRGKAPVVDFVVRSVYKDGRVIETPVMEARGGGLSSVVGFLLRLVIQLLSPKDNESIIFLDEPFAHVSSSYGPQLAEFIREIVDRTKIQVVIVLHTHVEEFLEVADRRYKFELNREGYTEVTEL
jgi:translation initiation factor RLI1